MDIIAIILSIISLLFSIGVFLSDRIRQKRLDTLNAINTLQEDWLSGLHSYIRKYNRDGKKALEAHLNNEDQDYYDYATNCLINLENFASGVDLGIYDLKVIKKCGGAFFCRIYGFLQPILERKLQTSPDGEHYEMYTKMVKKLRRYYVGKNIEYTPQKQS